MPWTATVLTIFPEMFPGPLAHSLAGKALAEKIWRIDTVDIRNFAQDRHRTVDDAPFGGGPGMVMRPDVIDRALNETPALGSTICLSPRGPRLTQARVAALAEGPGVRLLCGRFPKASINASSRRIRSKKRASAISCSRAASRRRSRCSMRSFACCLASSAMRRLWKRRAFSKASSNIPITRGRRIGRAAPCPRCCSRAITKTSAAGGWRKQNG